MRPCSPGDNPVTSDVNAVAVVEGAIDVMGPPEKPDNVGICSECDCSWFHPNPSRSNSTMRGAPATTDGIHEGTVVGPPGAHKTGTMFDRHPPEYWGRTGAGTLTPLVHHLRWLCASFYARRLCLPGTVVAGPSCRLVWPHLSA